MRRSFALVSRRLQSIMAQQPGVLRDLSTAAETVDVVCIDPRSVLQASSHPELLKDEKQFTRLKLPAPFLSQISKGVMELGELDDPLNSWYFGQKDEIFNYRLMGTHPTMSGFTSVIEQQELENICSNEGTVGLPDWEDFKADLQAGQIVFPSIRTPFLFAGAVLDSPAAAVYQLKKDGQVVGLAISSEAAEAD